MAWGNTDGPEMGPEWHGDDRGTKSYIGCIVAASTFVVSIILIVWIVRLVIEWPR